MSSARVDYIAPWWTYWLHNFPHINLRFQPIDNSFQPEEENYQQVSRGRWNTASLFITIQCMASTFQMPQLYQSEL